MPPAPDWPRATRGYAGSGVIVLSGRAVLRNNALRLSQGLNPFLTAQQLGGAGRFDCPTRREDKRDRSRGRVVWSLIDRHDVVLAEAVPADDQLAASRFKDGLDDLEAVLWLLDLCAQQSAVYAASYMYSGILSPPDTD